jgi:dolichol-phosphate mannosyltransferase
MNAIFALKENDISWEEVAIEVIYLDNNESSHFNPIKDSMKIYKVFAKFCISSLSSCLLDLGIFTLLIMALKEVFPLYYIFICTAIARVCSGIFNYFINRAIFAKKEKISSSSGKYLILWTVQLGISSIAVNGFARLFPLHETIVKLVVDTILFFLSYKFQQKWVFAKSKEEEESYRKVPENNKK